MFLLTEMLVQKMLCFLVENYLIPYVRRTIRSLAILAKLLSARLVIVSSLVEDPCDLWQWTTIADISSVFSYAGDVSVL